MLDSRHWKSAEATTAMPFALDGDAVPTSRTSTRRTWISSTEGVVAHVGDAYVRIEGERPVVMRYALPSEVDLTPLRGKRVRVTLVHTTAPDGGITQTLTVSGDDGRLHLVAHSGHVKGNAHQLGKLAVYVALSQRPGGPMVFGTARLQSLVRVGDSVRVRDGEDAYVLHFHARPATTHGAAYVIASDALWAARGA